MTLESETPIKLVHYLLQLQRERATGALSVTAEDISTIVHFQAGRAVFARSGALGQTLGRLLLDEGVIDERQYSLAIDELRRAVAIDRNARMGGVLVDLGITTTEEVQQALFRQMERRIAHLMQFTKPTWSFASGEAELRGIPRYPMRVEPLILEGIRLYYDHARMTRTLAPYRGGHLVLRAPVDLIVRCFSLRTDHAAVVASIDGTETTEAWLVRQEHEHAWPLTTALALTGVLGVVPAPPSRDSVERESRRNPSLAPAGSTGVFEVPVVRSAALPTAPALVSNTTRQPSPPDPSSYPSLEQLARLEAESACRIGIALLHAGELDEAEARFRTAVDAMPDAVEYQLYLAWTQSSREPARDPATLTMLEQLAATTARQDSRHAFPPYVTAHVALARGDRDTAHRFFKVAQHRDPDNKDAGVQLRNLARRPK